LRKYIHDHPGVVITFVYLYLSFIGLVYQYFHLKEFGLSIFDFSETNDYLIAFLKALPFLLVLLVLHFLIFIKDALFNQKHAPGDSFKQRLVALLVMSRRIELILFVLMLPILAGWIGSVRGNSITGHSLIEIDENIAKKVGISKNAYLFETTHDYMFLATESEKVVLRREVLGNFKVNSSNKSIQPTAKASAD